MVELLTPQCAENSAKKKKKKKSTVGLLAEATVFLSSWIPAVTSCVAACMASTESFSPTTVQQIQAKPTFSHQKSTTAANPKNLTYSIFPRLTSISMRDFWAFSELTRDAIQQGSPKKQVPSWSRYEEMSAGSVGPPGAKWVDGQRRFSAPPPGIWFFLFRLCLFLGCSPQVRLPDLSDHLAGFLQCLRRDEELEWRKREEDKHWAFWAPLPAADAFFSVSSILHASQA